MSDLGNSKNQPLLTPMQAAASVDSLDASLYKAVFKSPTIDSSLFGLQTAIDVDIFMKSPAGDALLTALDMQHFIEESHILNQRQEAAKHAALIHRIRAALCSWALEREALSSDRKELLLALNEEAIERAKPTETSSRNPEASINLTAALTHYQLALKLNAALIGKAKQEEMELKDLESELLTHEKLIEAKYEQLLKDIGQFELELSENSEIENLITNLKQEMEHSLLEMEGLINQPQTGDISTQMQNHTLLQLKLAIFEDRAAVQAGTLYYADEEGNELAYVDAEGNQTDFWKNAYFVLQCQSKIIKIDNQYYLLEPGQSWDSIKDDLVAKNAAQAHYERSKQNILTLKNVLFLNQNSEKVLNHQQLDVVRDKQDKNREYITFLNNQKGILESCLAHAEKELAHPDLAPKPKPSLTQNPAKNHTTIFHKALKPEPSPQLEFRRRVHNYQGPHAERFRLELRLIPLSQPIPQVTMNRMLATMEQFGLDATKPAVTAIKNPRELSDPMKKAKLRLDTPTPTPQSTRPKPTSAQKTKVLVPEPKAAAPSKEIPEPEYRSPTPLSTNPFDPYKGN